MTFAEALLPIIYHPPFYIHHPTESTNKRKINADARLGKLRILLKISSRQSGDRGDGRRGRRKKKKEGSQTSNDENFMTVFTI